MQVGHPALGRPLAVVVWRAVELVQIWPFSKTANGRQCFFYMRLSDFRSFGYARMKHDAVHRPVHRLMGRGAIEAE